VGGLAWSVVLARGCKKSRARHCVVAEVLEGGELPFEAMLGRRGI